MRRYDVSRMHRVDSYKRSEHYKHLGLTLWTDLDLAAQRAAEEEERARGNTLMPLSPDSEDYDTDSVSSLDLLSSQYSAASSKGRAANRREYYTCTERCFPDWCVNEDGVPVWMGDEFATGFFHQLQAHS